MDDQEPKKNKGGRPAKYPGEGRRPTLSLRVRGGLYEKLQSAAEKTSRTISEEMERRLERSFDDELDGLRRSLFGDRNTENLLRKIAWAARLIEDASSGQEGGHPISWSENVEMRAALREAIREIVVDATSYDPPVRSSNPVLGPLLGEEPTESDIAADAISDAQDRGRSVGRLICGNVAAIKVEPVKNFGIGTEKDW